MAYEIIGIIYKIGATEQIPTKSGNPFQKRTLTLMQQQYDRSTGQPLEPNYPSFEFTQRGCALLDQFQPNQLVKVTFDLAGRKFQSKKTGQEDYFTSLRAFRIESYIPPRPIQQGSYTPPPQNAYQQPQNGFQQGNYPPQSQGGYQQPPQGSYQQQPQGGYAPQPQGDDAPF